MMSLIRPRERDAVFLVSLVRKPIENQNHNKQFREFAVRASSGVAGTCCFVPLQTSYRLPTTTRLTFYQVDIIIVVQFLLIIVYTWRGKPIVGRRHKQIGRSLGQSVSHG